MMRPRRQRKIVGVGRDVCAAASFQQLHKQEMARKLHGVTASAVSNHAGFLMSGRSGGVIVREILYVTLSAFR